MAARPTEGVTEKKALLRTETKSMSSPAKNVGPEKSRIEMEKEQMRISMGNLGLSSEVKDESKEEKASSSTAEEKEEGENTETTDLIIDPDEEARYVADQVGAKFSGHGLGAKMMPDIKSIAIAIELHDEYVYRGLENEDWQHNMEEFVSGAIDRCPPMLGCYLVPIAEAHLDFLRNHGLDVRNSELTTESAI